MSRHEATPEHRRFGLLHTLAVLALLALILPNDAASAREPLRGSATVTQAADTGGKPYYPNNRTIRYADQLADDYKLGAAEAIYRGILKKSPKNAAAWNGLGKIAWYKTTSSNQNVRDHSEALLNEAAQDFMTALRYQPNYVEARSNLARVYLAQGRLQDAEAEIERAMALASQGSSVRADVLARKGELLVRQGLPMAAKDPLAESIRLRSNRNAAAHLYMGMVYAAQDHWDAALSELQTAQYQEPENALVHAQLGNVYDRQGNDAAAVEHWKEALRLKPELSEARKQLAGYYERQGNLDAALAEYRTLAGSDTQAVLATWPMTEHIGKLALQNDQPRLAIKAYRDWLAKNPDDSKAQAALSYAKSQLAKQKLRDDDLISQGEARRYAEQAVKYNPNNLDARLLQAKLDREIGVVNPVQTGKEPGLIDVALNQPSYQPYQSLEKGQLLLSRYQFAQAEAAFQDARRAAEGNRGQMLIGELFLTKGLPDLAEQSFNEVLRSLPGNDSARLGLGKAKDARLRSQTLVSEARTLRPDKQSSAPDARAIAKLQEALALNARNSDAYLLLAQLEERHTDYAQAADHYYAWLQLNPYAKNRPSIERRIEKLKQKLLSAGNN